MDIEEKLLELKKMVGSKKRFEKEHQGDEDIVEHIESVQTASQLQTLSQQVLQYLKSRSNSQDSRNKGGNFNKSRKSMQGYGGEGDTNQHGAAVEIAKK
jgi:hypothetical protein